MYSIVFFFLQNFFSAGKESNDEAQLVRPRDHLELRAPTSRFAIDAVKVIDIHEQKREHSIKVPCPELN